MARKMKDTDPEEELIQVFKVVIVLRNAPMISSLIITRSLNNARKFSVMQLQLMLNIMARNEISPLKISTNFY